jgi:N-acylneuraminate cytidylyltransferase
LAYSIAAAHQSGVFSAVIVSTDDDETARIAERFGGEVPFLRPASMAIDTSPDIEWVRYTLATLRSGRREWDCFSILRPTSPFRGPETIRRAWSAFTADGRAESLRAIQRCREHPGKMWTVDGGRMRPLLVGTVGDAPWHSAPYQSLPEIYIQNASLEIALTSLPLSSGSISGIEIMPFITDGLEGFDLNRPEDWLLAEHYVERQPDLLPAVEPA